MASDYPAAGQLAVIDSFTGPYRFLSSFYATPGIFRNPWAPDGYASAEHAVQAAKAITREQHDWIMTAPAPGEAKRRGRATPLRQDWNWARFIVMGWIVRDKFSATLRWHLNATGDSVLIEGNHWHDNLWGDCRCGRAACAREGSNYLGRILMCQRGMNRSIV